MTDKTQIIHELGGKELLLPEMIDDAIRANDRIKYYFTLLQSAKNSADNPEIQIQNLKSERLASGVASDVLDDITRQSSKVGDLYRIPYVGTIYEEIKKNVKIMMAPLSFEEFRRRFEIFLVQTRAPEGDTVSAEFIERMTSVASQSSSLHLLVMEMHKELNKLQASIYKESIDGAKTHGISEESDKLIVKAFMRGLNRTSKLKFDHPGLGTISTKSGADLVIQNDIGTTDAHVLVVRIRGLTATLTYTDVHLQRLSFFQSLFERHGVTWSNATARKSEELEEGSYFLTEGTYESKNLADLQNYLSFLGSRIVFLIDWNRARKRIANFVKKTDAVRVLKWAAENDVGHIAFLKMGGESVVIDAIERIPKVQLHYGQKVADVLGRDSATEFMKFVLKTSAEGALDSKSETLVRDEIRAELSKRFRSIHESLLEVARDHAELIVELGTTVRDAVLQLGANNFEFLPGVVKRAKKWEKDADDLLNKARQIISRSGEPRALEQVMEVVDDAADSLEEAIFLLSLVSEKDEPSFHEQLKELAELADKGAMEYLKAAEGSTILREAGRQEMDDFLSAVDMTSTIEHQADEAYRIAKTALISGARDFRQLHLFDQILTKIEESTDATMKAGIVLRNYVLEEIVAA